MHLSHWSSQGGTSVFVALIGSSLLRLVGWFPFGDTLHVVSDEIDPRRYSESVTAVVKAFPCTLILSTSPSLSSRSSHQYPSHINFAALGRTEFPLRPLTPKSQNSPLLTTTPPQHRNDALHSTTTLVVLGQTPLSPLPLLFPDNSNPSALKYGVAFCRVRKVCFPSRSVFWIFVFLFS